MQIFPATINDCQEILDLQMLAYKQEAEIYDDFTIPPLCQTLDEMKADFNVMTILKAVSENKIIGSVRANSANDTCYIGRLIVHPEYQNQGIGTGLMMEIEKKFNTIKRFELFTGEKSIKNIYLYQKLGYKRFKIEKLSEKVNTVYLEKII